MGIFQFGRTNGFPAIYSPNHTAVTVDVTETILIVVFIIISIAYISIIPSYRKRQSIYMTIKAALSIIIGCLLIVENFGQRWEYGSVRGNMFYRADKEIVADMEVKIGLRSVNITLKAEPEQNPELANEMINYNERFPWTWDQGRIGFGPYAGLLQRTFREGQRKGLPIPILWIAEYFVIDGEGFRFGRFYRTAGWYCHILLWTAFACWILANIFLQSVSRYTAYLIGIIGSLQLSTCLVWASVHNPLEILFEQKTETDVLKIDMHFGTHFWMTFGCGILCILLAIVMIFMDLRYPNTLSVFLAIDPLAQYDELVVRSNQMDDILFRKVHTDSSMEMTSMDDKNTGMILQKVMKRNSSMTNAQKSLFRGLAPVKIYDDVADYQNQVIAGPSKVPTIEINDEVTSPVKPLPVKSLPVKPPPVPRKKRSKPKIKV